MGNVLEELKNKLEKKGDQLEQSIENGKRYELDEGEYKILELNESGNYAYTGETLKLDETKKAMLITQATGSPKEIGNFLIDMGSDEFIIAVQKSDVSGLEQGEEYYRVWAYKNEDKSTVAGTDWFKANTPTHAALKYKKSNDALREGKIWDVAKESDVTEVTENMIWNRPKFKQEGGEVQQPNRTDSRIKKLGELYDKISGASYIAEGAQSESEWQDALDVINKAEVLALQIKKDYRGSKDLINKVLGAIDRQRDAIESRDKDEVFEHADYALEALKNYRRKGLKQRDLTEEAEILAEILSDSVDVDDIAPQYHQGWSIVDEFNHRTKTGDRDPVKILKEILQKAKDIDDTLFYSQRTTVLDEFKNRI